MFKKYITGVFFIALLGTAGILLAGKPNPANKERAPKEAPSSCKNAAQPCTPSQPVAPATTLEHLSQQFISIPVLVR